MAASKLECVIHWYRRDLRISDHPGLCAAVASGLPVVAVYVMSEWCGGHRWTGPNRQKFLCESVAALAKNLETIGGRLVIRVGAAVEQLLKLAVECRAVAIHAHADPDPFGKQVEAELAMACRDAGIFLHLHADVALHPAEEICNLEGKPYRVFTPYSRNWLAREKPRPLAKVRILGSPAGIASMPLPTLADWKLQEADVGTGLLEGGERAALKRLDAALKQVIRRYDQTRDLPALAGTSRLSQDLRHGLISIRTVFAKVAEARAAERGRPRQAIDCFIKELAWREFYFAILHHFPNVLDEEFNPEWRGLRWDPPDEKLERWQQGRTGFPIVDAGMRQLATTGFMHNRVRMITAMFFTKDLHYNWRLGESWFMRQLVDGEIAANNGGWQWSAGTGADAAPYFRIQNPWAQTARYDANGEYIRKWVPELAKVPPKLLLSPPTDGKGIACGYPPPCLDHKTERERTLEIFKTHRGR